MIRAILGLIFTTLGIAGALYVHSRRPIEGFGDAIDRSVQGQEWMLEAEPYFILMGLCVASALLGFRFMLLVGKKN